MSFSEKKSKAKPLVTGKHHRDLEVHDMQVFIKHQRGPHPGTWSATDYTIHIARAGRTLCKNGRPDGPADGSLSARGWRYQKHCSPALISCFSCLQYLERLAAATTVSPELSPHVHVQPEWLDKLRQATTIRQAHYYLALLCAASLTESEISTHQHFGLFSPEQCCRLLHLLFEQGIPLDPALLGFEQSSARPV